MAAKPKKDKKKTGVLNFTRNLIFGLPDITQQSPPLPPVPPKSDVYTDSSKLFPQVPKYPSTVSIPEVTLNPDGTPEVSRYTVPAPPPRDPSKDRPADPPIPQKTLRQEVGDIAAPSLEALGLAAADPADAPMETGEDFGGGTAPFEAPQYEGTPPPKPAKKQTEILPYLQGSDTGIRLPMTQAQFDALPTQQRMEADMAMAKMGLNRQELIVPTAFDAGAGYGGKPKYSLELGELPKGYIDSRNPGRGKFVDAETGDVYFLTGGDEYSQFIRSQRPLVRGAYYDAGEGVEGDHSGKFGAFRSRMKQGLKDYNFKTPDAETAAKLDQQVEELDAAMAKDELTRALSPEGMEAQGNIRRSTAEGEATQLAADKIRADRKRLAQAGLTDEEYAEALANQAAGPEIPDIRIDPEMGKKAASAPSREPQPDFVQTTTEKFVDDPDRVQAGPTLTEPGVGEYTPLLPLSVEEQKAMQGPRFRTTQPAGYTLKERPLPQRVDPDKAPPLSYDTSAIDQELGGEIESAEQREKLDTALEKTDALNKVLNRPLTELAGGLERPDEFEDLDESFLDATEQNLLEREGIRRGEIPVLSEEMSEPELEKFYSLVFGVPYDRYSAEPVSALDMIRQYAADPRFAGTSPREYRAMFD
tara:strand:+ start:4955 stop:6886 length:1932 start_codon:yes stop_codon:yes gene_type:complete